MFCRTSLEGELSVRNAKDGRSDVEGGAGRRTVVRNALYDGGVERWSCQCEVIKKLSDIDSLAAGRRSMGERAPRRGWHDIVAVMLESTWSEKCRWILRVSMQRL